VATRVEMRKIDQSCLRRLEETCRQRKAHPLGRAQPARAQPSHEWRLGMARQLRWAPALAMQVDVLKATRQLAVSQAQQPP
jgi:hypothetical protein